MNQIKTFILSVVLVAGAFFAGSCNKANENPVDPHAVIRIDIDPNSTFYQGLNAVGGWIYVKNGDQGAYVGEGSRGVIIYRETQTDFKAYDRLPPNSPNQCGNSVKLIVGKYYPFAKDTCTGNTYQLLDGSLFEGNGRYPMIQYHAIYDGNLLHVYN
jgi:hypothetical protein